MLNDEELISEDKRIDVLEDEKNCQIVEAKYPYHIHRGRGTVKA